MDLAQSSIGEATNKRDLKGHEDSKLCPHHGQVSFGNYWVLAYLFIYPSLFHSVNSMLIKLALWRVDMYSAELGWSYYLTDHPGKKYPAVTFVIIMAVVQSLIVQSIVVSNSAFV